MRRRNTIFILILVVGLIACRGEDHRPTTVIVYGGAERLSGSMTLIEHGNQKFLTDCGSYYPEGNGADWDSRKQEADSLSLVFPFDPAEIVAVLITHAHMDHMGRIPLLCDRGFTGKIYSFG